MATSAGTIPINAIFNGAQLEKDVLSALNRIQSKSSLNLNTRNFTQPLGKITGLANEFNKSLEASNARVVAFGASAGVIFAVQKSFTALVASTIEVEKALTDINVVLNTSSSGIKKFGDQLFDVAKNTGSAFKDVAGAATEFSRQGLGLEETLKRTRDALILTRLSGLDVVSSTEALTAAVNSFTKEALTTTDVVNKLAAVDAKFAVSSRDLSEALQRVGSSASEAGVSFDELLGIVTSVQQTTARGGAVIGNALKTIFTRIERPQVINDLRDFGVVVTDISGNTLPTIKVIENLAQSFQNLNPVVKSQVAELVGGVYQINILKAALADVSKQNSAFAEATRASSQAADEAIIKNDALNKSLSALINETTVNFTQFASKIGNVSIAPGIRKVLSNIVNPALESFNGKEVEGVGAKIATGLLTGLTDFITGPGLGLGALAIGKLIANFTGFAGDAAKNLLGVGKDQAIIQGEISKILSNNPQLIQQIIAGSKSRLQVEKEIKQILIEQAAISKSIKDNSKDITARFSASGLTVSPQTGLIQGRNSAAGYIPAKQQAAEMVGAMQGGYAPGKVVAAPKSIGGVMNTAETVKYVPGFAQPYILPPQGSSAARNLTSKSMAKNGINPYKARGFVPNFAGTDFTNPYGYGDDQWFRDGGKNPFPVPLSQIKITNAAGDVSGFDGIRFYKKDKKGNEKKFTAIDLNAFLKRGATYGQLREYAPDYILKTDPRYGKRKPDGSTFDVDDIKKDFVPGKKIEGEDIIGEGIKKVYNAYIPPASMLVFDAMQKSSERDINEDDLEEKIGEMSTKRKTSGRIFRIKSYALNASALNEEKTGLIQKTKDFSRKVTKDLANYIRPGEYSDSSVDTFFEAAGKNYNVLAGTIFEASTNLAANYTRDKSNAGGDFDVRGGNIGNVRELFPGFTDQYGDYKLKNNDEAIRSFIDKVTKQYGPQIGDHFKEQEIKAGGVTSGLKTSSLGFIPNFAPKPFNFRFSSLGEKTAQISPKLRDWLADKYFDPEMASPEMLERLASLNRDSGAFFSSLENPNAVAGIPVRGQQGFVSRQNRGARAGAFLNALRTRLPSFVPGSLPALASGFIPNFAYKIYKPTASKTATREITDPSTNSYLRYYPGSHFNPETKSDEKSLNISFIRSYQKGQGQQMFDRFSKMARRLGVKGFSDLIIPQKENLQKIVPQEEYDRLSAMLSKKELEDYSVLEKLSINDIAKIAYPQLSYRQKGLSKNSSLQLQYRNYAGSLQFEKFSSKNILSEIQNKIKSIYGNDKQSFIEDVLDGHIYISDLRDTFSKGHVPNFAYKLTKRKQFEKDKKNNFRTLTDPETGSFLNYYPGSFLNPNTGSYESGLKISYIESSKRGQGQEMFDRYSKTAKRLGVNSYSSTIIPQKDKLKKIVPQKQYDLLREEDREKYYALEKTSIEDIVKIAFPQLSYRQKGLSKSTNLKFSNRNYIGSIDEEEVFGKHILYLVQNKIKDLYKNDKQSLIDALLDGDINIDTLVDTFSKGHVPNFNAVKEAMGREMAAGYSSSQVRLGQSSKLKTSFNPMGLGVYNSTEGSLNNGIGLAEKAGINPKTKGMSAKGHIPNFAETSGFDLFAMTAAFSALIFSVRQTSDSLKQLTLANESIKKDNISAAASFSQKIKQIPLDFNKSQQAIRDEVKKTFTNIDPKKLNLRGGAVAPLVSGGFARDPVSGLMVRQADKAASPQQVARLEELRKQLAEARKKANEDLVAARQGRQEAVAAAKAVDAPYFGKGMFAQNSKLSGLLKAGGPGAAVVASTLASVGGQFIPEKNKQARAAVSGLSDVAQYAGTGAVFGAPGAAIGAIVGLGFALKKFSDAKAEEAVDKINDSLDKTKEKAAEFSGAAQNYSTSLESLQNALNDPKSRPEALLKFQNNLTEALNSIPEEFREKVLKAGTDITKVAEAISGVNKELGNTQKNLEKQLAITQIIKEESSFFGPANVSPKNQKSLNALFASSVNAESITKNFGGVSGATDFGSFIESLKSQAIYTRDVYGMSGGMAAAQKIGTERAVNKESVEGIKSELKSRGILTEDIANQLDQAFSSLKPEAIESIVDALKKQGLSILDNSKRSKILSEILEDNTKRVRRNEEALKNLSDQYNNINLQISNQIDIEKNRAKTIREINKIQAEGTVSIQRAKVKGLLDASSSFISEGTKNDIQNQLDINEIITRQNSKIQDAANSLLDSFTETVIKRSEEARSKVEGAVTDPTKDANDIQKERNRFQQTIQRLNPLINQSLKDINSGGNVGDIKTALEQQIRAFATFKPEERDVIIQSLGSSFEDFKNKLAEIKAQGDIDIKIQEAQREYQKQSLALNQRLSFAGGAQALGSTGKAGVSDLFDNITDLVSELRQTNTIGNAAQRGSSAFKFLDILTNQLQLNRNISAPSLPNGFAGPNISGDMFNKQVSSDLNPLAATAIAGRVQQIRESLDLARNVAEIQTGKSTQGTALGAAFDMAKEGAVQTALDQIASQFKLENMGSYLDVLQQEARFLNSLTEDQNKILAQTLPDSLNKNFSDVIETRVGKRLDTLTSSLSQTINNLATFSQRTNIETEISNRLPTNVGPQARNAILERIKSAGELKPLQMTEVDMEGRKALEDLNRKDEEELRQYQQSLAAIKSDKEKMSGGTSSAGEQGLYFIRDMRKKYGFSGEPSAEEFAKRQNSRAFASELPSQMVDTTKLAGTYQEFINTINQDFGAQMTEQQVKDLQRLTSEKDKLNNSPSLMSTNQQSQLGPFYKFNASTPYSARVVPDSLNTARGTTDRSNLITERLKSQEDIVRLEKEINQLLKEDLNDADKREELTRLQVKLRKRNLEQENKTAKYNFDLYYKSEFGRTAFRDEKAAQANALIESEARQGKVAVGAITQKNTEYNRADFARDTGQLIDTFQTDFKSGIASAFGEAIKGTKTLKDAFRDMFQGILNRMLDKSLEMGVDALFAFGKAAAGFKNGGEIKKYNSGGMVTGGSGMKDDVPAMMSGGEYVIKKSSVNKYGANYLRALNGGLVPKYATGGFSIGPLQNEFLYNDPERPTSGEYAVDSRLSAMALSDENNPQNRIREDRFNKLDQYLQDRDQFERDKKQALKNYRNQVNSTFYSGLTAAAVQLGTAGLTMGAEKLRTPKATVGKPYQAYSSTFPNYTGKKANGGYIPKFAGGGYTGKDNIPALLMGGEYVMNKKAVDMYGRDFMGQLNSGTLPKYANGGMVGTSYTGQNTPQGSVEELVAALNTLNENLSKDTRITQSESGKISAAGVTQESGMSVVNNISINMTQGGEVTSEANASTQQGKDTNQNNIQNNAKLAELLRSKVVEVLVEQKRPGGLLYGSR